MTAHSHPPGRYFDTLGEGAVDWIGLRPRRREPLMAMPRAIAIAIRGLEGDHRMLKTPGSGRQVTLISAQFIDHLASQLGMKELHPIPLRRNIVISGINPNVPRRQHFWVGEALLEASQLCHPCARMEAKLGSGGVIAMHGYGGLCAKIISSGEIEIGAAVRWLGPSS